MNLSELYTAKIEPLPKLLVIIVEQNPKPLSHGKSGIRAKAQ